MLGGSFVTRPSIYRIHAKNRLKVFVFDPVSKIFV